MNCPSCRAPADEAAQECTACGVVFAKWKEVQKRKAAEAAAALAALEVAKVPGETWNPWKMRIVAGAFVALWMLGIAIYYHLRLSALARPPRPEQDGDVVEVRDIHTGQLRRVKIRNTAP
jgi:hypothetical protein